MFVAGEVLILQAPHAVEAQHRPLARRHHQAETPRADRRGIVPGSGRYAFAGESLDVSVIGRLVTRDPADETTTSQTDTPRGCPVAQAHF